MTSRRTLQRRLQTLSEIAGIMESMKTLSLMETWKLAGVLECQKRVVDGIEAAAQDFRTFHPGIAERHATGSQTWIVIGSDRGFCGDFNEALVAAVERLTGDGAGRPMQLVVIGRKLIGALRETVHTVASLDGPSVVEDVPHVLLRVVEITNELVDASPPMSLGLLHHGDEIGTLRTTTLLPPFHELEDTTPRPASPPCLYLPVEQFYSELVDHYVFARLHEAFYVSLMAEHQRRVRHLDNAVSHLDDRVGELTKKRNALRQEEITEEIELIMLSARNRRPSLNEI